MEYELTQEGKIYLTEGLPEKKLLKLLEKKTLSIQEVSGLLRNPQIAISWAKKMGWIKLSSGRIFLTDAGKKPSGIEDLELALSKINRGEPVSKEKLSLLKKRKLVRKKYEKVEHKLYDISEPGAKIYPGKYQPYKRIIDEVKEKLLSLGFKEMKGPLVELSFWNCDVLFTPQDHPARSIHDILYIENLGLGSMEDQDLTRRVKLTHESGWKTKSIGWGGKWKEEEALKLLLRSQTTSVSARKLYELGEREGKYFSIGRVYRHDVIDATHLMEFYQCEGIVIGKGLNFKHLLGYLKEIALALEIKELKFRPAYFPFTEPSVEGLIYHPKLKWIEALAGGIFRPELLFPLGIKKTKVLAWGLGLDRLTMTKLGIEDIRKLFSKDLNFLRKKEVIQCQ